MFTGIVTAFCVVFWESLSWAHKRKMGPFQKHVHWSLEAGDGDSGIVSAREGDTELCLTAPSPSTLTIGLYAACLVTPAECGVHCSALFLAGSCIEFGFCWLKVREADLFEMRSWKKSPSAVIWPEGSMWTCQNKYIYICINYPQYNESQGRAQAVAHSAACWECCMAESRGPK